MMATAAPKPILFVGPKHICPQIAYVLDIQAYACVEKLTKQNFEQYRDYQIYVCEFKRKSRRFVKLGGGYKNLNLRYLEDICCKIDEENYPNHQGHKSNYQKYQIQCKQQKAIRQRNFGFLQKYLPKLKPSELMLYVLSAKPNPKIWCTRLETNIRVSVKGDLKGCCHVMLPFGNLTKQGELSEIYHSTYARIVKLSSLNRSYCLCNLNRWCKGCSQVKSSSTEQWKTDVIPRTVSLSFDQSCNLCCKSCRTEPYVADEITQQHLSMIVAKLLRSGYLEQTQTLVVAGMGEAFYSPSYRQILTTNLRRNTINLFSNGTLFNQDNWRLVAGRYKIINVQISVDAATAETYQKLRGADFDNLMRNLTMLSDLRRQNQIRYFQLNFVVQRDNFHEMSAFVKLGQSLGVDSIQFQAMSRFSRSVTAAQTLLENCLIIDNCYLNYELWRVLQDPIFRDPIVNLEALRYYIDMSERRYRKRYEREQRRSV